MMEDERISFVIPVFKPDIDFLKECIQSIISDSYSNVEIILVTDGDYSLNLIKDEICPFGDNKIKLYSIPHSGVGNARNFGVIQATGKFLRFIDQDDMIVQHSTSTMIELMKEHNSDFVTGNIFKLSNNVFEECWLSKVYSESNNNLTLSGQVSFISDPFIWNKCFTREWFIQHVFPFEKRDFEDVVASAKSFINGNFCCLKYPVYIYRQHAASITHSREDSCLFKDHIIQLKKVKELILRDSNLELLNFWINNLFENELRMYYSSFNQDKRFRLIFKREMKEILTKIPQEIVDEITKKFIYYIV